MSNDFDRALGDDIAFVLLTATTQDEFEEGLAAQGITLYKRKLDDGKESWTYGRVDPEHPRKNGKLSRCKASALCPEFTYEAVQEALTRNAEEQRRIAEELARKTEARAEEKAYRADVKATEKAMLVSVDGNLADEVAALTGVKAKGSCAEHAIAARVTARKVVQRVPFDREAWEQGKAQKRMAKELGY